MDNFEFSKLGGAVLAVGLFTFIVNEFSHSLFHSETLEEPAYKVAGLDYDSLGGSASSASAEPEAEPEPELDFATLLLQADVDAGERISGRCAACHSFNEGGANRVGPNLWNIVNRPSGSKEGFNYSNALAGFNQPWTYERLNGFLAGPANYIEGTSMAYAGLREAEDRANLIGWLRTLSADPAPLPEPTTVEPAEEPEPIVETDGAVIETLSPAEAPIEEAGVIEASAEDTAEDAAETVAAVLEDTTGEAAETVDATVDAVEETAETVTEGAADAAAGAAETLETAAEDVAETVEDTADAAAEVSEDAAEAAEDAAEEVTEAADAAADAAEETVEEAIEATDDAAEDVADAAEDATEEVIETADDVVETVEETTEAAAAPAPGSEIGRLVAAADVSAGERVAGRCKACHTVAEGAPNRVGPNLWNVVGRTSGSVEGFRYSAAMKNFGEVWTVEQLYEYLENPRGIVQGTTMAFGGIKDETDRANLVAYLRSLSNDPVPLP
ncbi:MAG: c-type cytochrome [Maricaulaceae bacterium]